MSVRAAHRHVDADQWPAGPFGAMTSQAAAHGMLTMEEPQLALAAPASLCAGERDAIQILRRLVLRAKPTSI